MQEHVSKEQIKAARKADLYAYLLRHHKYDVVKEGDSIRLSCNHSVSIKEGYSGYTDFATDETGNAVDCLMEYFDYTLQDAVMALCTETGNAHPGSVNVPVQDTGHPEKRPCQKKPFVLPESRPDEIKEISIYLNGHRFLPTDILFELIRDGILYQDAIHKNAVFVNAERDFAEIRGTSPQNPFHQVMHDDNPCAFWWFNGNGLDSEADVALICESAIDAVSLYCINRSYSTWNHNGLYCSIAGVANQQRIDQIKAGMSAAGMQTILAVDNDDAGEQCRRRNPDCGYIIPNLKDWNEVWVNMCKTDPDRFPHT